MDFPLYEHNRTSPTTSQLDKHDLARLSPWRQQSPYRISPPGNMVPMWGQQSPFKTASPWGAPPSWRTPSPLAMNINPGFANNLSNVGSLDRDNTSRFQGNPVSASPIFQEMTYPNPFSASPRSFVIPSLNATPSRQFPPSTPESLTFVQANTQEQLAAVASTRSRFSTEQWENHRSTIQRLWVDEDKSLEETKRIMTEKFDFSPSSIFGNSIIFLYPCQHSLTAVSSVISCISRNSSNGAGQST